jgi:UDP-N-acetyl-D-mannosaminuronic acid transferase (WecB/TagA/CpsF family)
MVPPPQFESSFDHYRRILGVLFYVGPIEGLLERTMRGGLIVVPSAPVLVSLTADPVHRRAIETSDLAVTDSGFMVLLWRLFTRQKIIRISGLRYVRALMDDARFRNSKDIFWIMPSKRDEIGNRAWLMEQGMTVEEEDCYLAPMYAREGPLEDPVLLAKIEARRPQFVMINLGGGVQERLGLYLRDELAKISEAQSGKGEALSVKREEVSGKREEGVAKSEALSANAQDSGPFALGSLPSAAPAYRPSLICTGAAIAFLSNRQVNIPPWADRLFLGWLMRSLSEPTKFVPRYWHSLRLAVLMWKFGSRSVAS